MTEPAGCSSADGHAADVGRQPLLERLQLGVQRLRTGPIARAAVFVLEVAMNPSALASSSIPTKLIRDRKKSFDAAAYVVSAAISTASTAVGR